MLTNFIDFLFHYIFVFKLWNKVNKFLCILSKKQKYFWTFSLLYIPSFSRSCFLSLIFTHYDIRITNAWNMLNTFTESLDAWFNCLDLRSEIIHSHIYIIFIMIVSFEDTVVDTNFWPSYKNRSQKIGCLIKFFLNKIKFMN